MSSLERSLGKRANKTSLEDQAISKLKWWFHLANIWRAIDNLLVIMSFASSMCVVYIEASNKIPNKVIGVLVGSVLAAMFTVLSFAIDPKTHMRNYRKAYYELHNALIETRFDSEKDENNKKLTSALQKGEAIINASYETES